MSGFDSNDPRDEALWSLLGRARPAGASPYFARKVLRAAAAGIDARPGWLQVLLRMVAPAAACAILTALAVVGIHRAAPTSATAEIEFETIQNLDLLVSNYESSLWLDPSSPSF
ncbi:MAG: hypothetical protein PHC88_03535 [Terrimicrobiaceae bacterium]|nr:hypothetical protein [Terrimicrobiaceae bacterium]